MAILETAIMLGDEYLIEKQFYSTEDVLDKNIRHALLRTIPNLANVAFGESIQGFSIGDYAVVIVMHTIEIPSKDKNSQATEKKQLLMYTIVDKESDEDVIKKVMDKALFQFTNRFSWYDIIERKSKKFKKFTPRLTKIFGDLVLKSEDRFKSIF